MKLRVLASGLPPHTRYRFVFRSLELGYVSSPRFGYDIECSNATRRRVALSPQNTLRRTSLPRHQSTPTLKRQTYNREPVARPGSIGLGDDNAEYILIVESNEVLVKVDAEMHAVHRYVNDVYTKKFPELASGPGAREKNKWHFFLTKCLTHVVYLCGARFSLETDLATRASRRREEEEASLPRHMAPKNMREKKRARLSREAWFFSRSHSRVLLATSRRTRSFRASWTTCASQRHSDRYRDRAFFAFRHSKSASFFTHSVFFDLVAIER